MDLNSFYEERQRQPGYGRKLLGCVTSHNPGTTRSAPRCVAGIGLKLRDDIAGKVLYSAVIEPMIINKKMIVAVS